MLKAGNKKKKEMVGGYSRTRTYYFRRCKNSVTDCVPDEVLYEILLRLPAQDIFSAMLVCRKWYQIVHSSYKIFIRKHLEHSSYGLLYRNISNEVVFTYARKVGGGIDTIKLNYIPRFSNWSSCNGLVLEHAQNIHYVRNVLSHQIFCLPQLPYRVGSLVSCVIGYDAASMKYKVVSPCGGMTHPFEMPEPYMPGILTVGVDKSWRNLSTYNLSDLGKDAIMWGDRILTEAFVHWRERYVNKIVTLNLETEVFVEAPLPVTSDGCWLLSSERCCFLSSGRYLTVFSRCEKFVWEVLEMKSETGEWKKLPNICLEGIEGKIKRLGINLEHDYVASIKPLGWLKYPELLAFRFQDVHIIFYDFITCEICAKTLPISYNSFRVTLHKNSLVRVGEF